MEDNDAGVSEHQRCFRARSSRLIPVVTSQWPATGVGWWGHAPAPCSTCNTWRSARRGRGRRSCRRGLYLVRGRCSGHKLCRNTRCVCVRARARACVCVCVFFANARSKKRWKWHARSIKTILYYSFFIINWKFCCRGIKLRCPRDTWKSDHCLATNAVGKPTCLRSSYLQTWSLLGHQYNRQTDKQLLCHHFCKYVF